MLVAGLKPSPTRQSPFLHPSPVQNATTQPSLSRGAFWGDELPRGEYSLALRKKKAHVLTDTSVSRLASIWKAVQLYGICSDTVFTSPNSLNK